MTTATEAGLLADICEHAADDTARLVYADWLEENGRPERAEFIRVQCRMADMERKYDPQSPLPEGHPAHAEWLALRRREGALLKAGWFPWTRGLPLIAIHHDSRNTLAGGHMGAIFRRGFVSQVTLTLADWYGGACGRCDGDGQAHGSDRPFEWSADPDYMKCPVCKGAGRVGGHGPALVRAAPLERVTLSDKRPMQGQPWGLDDLRFGWYSHAEASAGATNLPPPLFAALKGGIADSYPLDPLPVRWYESEPQALDALSTAALAWAGG
jgi:uncharacterized protein (TIGR02996 family)